MEYADKLQNELKEAHETIGALIGCLEMVLDKNHTITAERIAITLIEKIRAERIYNETNRK